MKHTGFLQKIISLFYLFAATISLSQPNIKDSSYFPLNKGNQWYYRGLNTVFKASRKSLDTISTNGYLYYQMETIIRIGSVIPFKDNKWYRNSNDSIFVRFTDQYHDSTETLVFNFNANVGDTLLVKDCLLGEKIILLNKDDTVITASGTYYHCYHFQHWYGCTSDGFSDSWIAPKIGIVKFITRVPNTSTSTYELDSSALIASVRNLHIDGNLSSYLLFECYPNPFNPLTTLIYETRRSSVVTLRIFDLLGREIVQLVNEYKEPGNYRVIWNAERFPSGVYFGVLRSNDYSLTKKIIFQK